MTLVVDKFKSLLPPRTKTSPSGWLSFNAPCCHHRGHGQDTRKRAGIRFVDGFVYNCFNCKYTASWQPGRPISEKLKTLCQWLGAGQDDIGQLVFEALKTEAADYIPEESSPKVDFTEKPLPEDSRTLYNWALEPKGLPEDLFKNLTDVIQYVIDRGFDPQDSRFFWSPSAGYSDRLIICFYYGGRIVGNTARKIRDGRPKYLSDHHPQFVFNMDEQADENRYVFVCEGPLDAISVGGLALMTNDISDQQARIINSLGKQVIVIPDQDQAGIALINKAIEYNWSVAFPNWDPAVKDAADAVGKYGRLFVTVDAVKTAQSGEIKISVMRNQMETRLELDKDR